MLDQPATTGAASAMAIDRRLLKRVFGWLAIDGHLPPSRWGIGLQRGDAICTRQSGAQLIGRSLAAGKATSSI
jgi:hypothetical protein